MEMKLKKSRHAAPWRIPAFTVAAILLLSAISPFSTQAQNADPPDPLIAKARANVEQFFQQFAFLRYQEDISQQKLTGTEKVQYKRDTIYDSIFRMHYEDGKLRVDEQRIVEKLPARVDARPLLVTNGFSSMAMIFHPYYESSFHFSRIEDATLEGKSLARYNFEHVPGTPSPIQYQMIGAERSLAITGVAWLDPATGNVAKIDIEAGAGLADVGLKAIRAELTYGAIPLRDETNPQWFPVSATIDLETPHQHWRNIHKFSDYRKYRVDVRMEGTGTP